VHVRRFAANESLVRFDFAAGTTPNFAASKRPLFQSLTNPLKHEPCRLLGNAKRPRQFVGRDSVSAIRKHPDRNHPLIKTKGGVFHDGFNLHGELFLAGIAEPNPARLDERELFSATPRAVNATIREAKFHGILESPLGVRKVCNRVLQSLWLANHERILH